MMYESSLSLTRSNSGSGMHSIDWDTLDPSQCINTIEMLIELPTDTSITSTIEQGIRALLSHASSEDIDIEVHTSIAFILKETAILSPIIIPSILLEALPIISQPIGYLNILPNLLSHNNMHLAVTTISVLENLLHSDSQLILPILHALCDLHDTSNDLSSTIQSLLETAVDMVNDDQLASLLSLISKSSKIIDIDTVVKKLHSAFTHLNISTIIQVIESLLKISQTSHIITDSFLPCLLNTSSTSLRTSIDTMLMLIGFANNNSKYRKLLFYDLNASSTLIADIERVIELQFPSTSAKSIHMLAWKIIPNLTELISTMTVSDSKKFLLHQQLTNLMSSLFAHEPSLRDIVIYYLINCVFNPSKDSSSDTKLTSSLPPLGCACADYMNEMKKRHEIPNETTLSALSIFILRQLNCSTVAGKSVGSILFSTLLSKLQPDNNSLVTLIPSDALKNVLCIIIQAAAVNTDLHASVLMLAQKLLGNRWGHTESLLSSVLGSAQTSASAMFRQNTSDVCYRMHSIGVLLATSILTSESIKLQASDRTTLVISLCQGFENSVYDDSLLYILQAIYAIVSTKSASDSDSENDINSTVTRAIDSLYREGGVLYHADCCKDSVRYTLTISNVTDRAVRKCDIMSIALKSCQILDGKFLQMSLDSSSWVALLKESAELMMICCKIDSCQENVLSIELSNEVITCIQFPNKWRTAADLIAYYSPLPIRSRIKLCFELHLLIHAVYGYAIATNHIPKASDVSHTIVFFHAINNILALAHSLDPKSSKLFRSPSKQEKKENNLHEFGLTTAQTIKSTVSELLSKIPNDRLESALLILNSYDILFTELGLSLVVCYVSSISQSINIFENEIIYTQVLESNVMYKLIRNLNTVIIEIEAYRQIFEKDKDLKECIFIENEQSFSAGKYFDYEEYAMFSIIIYYFIYYHIERCQSLSQNTEEYCSRMNYDVFLSNLITNQVLRIDSIPNRENIPSVCLLYSYIEKQVKTIQDSTIAIAGYKLLYQLSLHTNLSSRCSSLSFLLSTLVFTNHTQLHELNNCFFNIILSKVSAFISMTTIRNDFSNQQIVNFSNTTSARLVLSLFKYLQNSDNCGSMNDTSVSIIFYLSWWFQEKSVNQLAGLSILLLDIMSLFMNVSFACSRSRAKGSDCLGQLQESCASAVSTGVETAATTATEEILSSQRTPISTSKVRRIVVNDDVEDAPSVRKKVKVSYQSPGATSFERHRQSFTSLSSVNAHQFFEISFLLLPHSIQSCFPSSQLLVASKRHDHLLGGPYKHIVIGFMVALRALKQLLEMMKDGENPRFFIDICSTVIRGCSSLHESIVCVLSKCAEWRNNQRSSSSSDIDENTTDLGSLYFSLSSVAGVTICPIVMYSF